MPCWLIETEDGPGINGGLMPRRAPAQPRVNSMTVTDLGGLLKTVEQPGGNCVVPKMAIPGMGWLAYCKDTEGHLFDRKAKKDGTGSRFPRIEAVLY